VWTHILTWCNATEKMEFAACSRTCLDLARSRESWRGVRVEGLRNSTKFTRLFPDVMRSAHALECTIGADGFANATDFFAATGFNSRLVELHCFVACVPRTTPLTATSRCETTIKHCGTTTNAYEAWRDDDIALFPTLFPSLAILDLTNTRSDCQITVAGDILVSLVTHLPGLVHLQLTGYSVTTSMHKLQIPARMRHLHLQSHATMSASGHRERSTLTRPLRLTFPDAVLQSDICDVGDRGDGGNGDTGTRALALASALESMWVDDRMGCALDKDADPSVLKQLRRATLAGASVATGRQLLALFCHPRLVTLHLSHTGLSDRLATADDSSIIADVDCVTLPNMSQLIVFDSPVSKVKSSLGHTFQRSTRFGAFRTHET
jgi:hypothetical protein